METRKIQFVGGSTYSVSLPKEWIKKNNLKKKNLVSLYEKDDKTLIISSQHNKREEIDQISLDVEDYSTNIDQILFATYYQGIEQIHLRSKTGLTKEIKSKIRKTITHMSGTEISYEDKNVITINVLLDKSKVDIIQTIYRISLIIESSISNILEGLDIREIRINENEIDRLYHLIVKIISLSLRDSNILHSSKIKNVSLIPAYFLISKRLENIADNINHLSGYLHKKKVNFENKEDVLNFIKMELKRSIKHIIGGSKNIFQKVDVKHWITMNESISPIKDKTIENHLKEIIRYLINVEEEIVNISFYEKLIRDGIL